MASNGCMRCLHGPVSGTKAARAAMPRSSSARSQLRVLAYSPTAEVASPSSTSNSANALEARSIAAQRRLLSVTIRNPVPLPRLVIADAATCVVLREEIEPHIQQAEQAAPVSEIAKYAAGMSFSGSANEPKQIQMPDGHTITMPPAIGAVSPAIYARARMSQGNPNKNAVKPSRPPSKLRIL